MAIINININIKIIIVKRQKKTNVIVNLRPVYILRINFKFIYPDEHYRDQICENYHMMRIRVITS